MASRDFYSDGVEREKWPEDVRDECARAALALTALFDGEANEADACLAESHLVNCARCAWLWQSWTRSRFLLRRMPVPEVPPGLLMRVLLAVRLMSFSKNAAQRGTGTMPATMNFEPRSGKARDARVLAETVWMAGANPFAPRRKSASSPNSVPAPELPPLDAALPQPPADLYARILSQTVKNAPLEPQVEPQIATPMLADEAEHESVVTAFTRRKPLWATSKTFSSALLPAAAAWLFLLARAPQLAETFHAPLSPVAAPSLNLPLHRQMRLSRKPVATGGAVKGTVAENSVSPRFAALSEHDTQVERNEEERSTEREPNYTSPVHESPDTPHFMTAASTPDENESPVAQPAMNWQGTAPSPPPSPAVSVAALPQPSVLKVAPRRAPAMSIVPVAFGSRHAQWSAPDVPTPDERAAQWHAAPRHAMSPVAASQPRDEDDAAPDAAEIINHSAHLTDSRPDDVADVVDDFRASLMAATADDAPATPDGENG